MYQRGTKKDKKLKEDVILVDQNDQEIGLMPKMEVHLSGALHRAFSVFIFNKKGELLLQQRAFDKYHSGGMWTNTCCSHPRAGEETLQAAQRRLREEMGLTCDLSHQFHFIYKAEVADGLYEHELDHVYFGKSEAPPVLEPAEVAASKYISMEQLAQELRHHPERYSAWLKICFDRVLNSYQSWVC